MKIQKKINESTDIAVYRKLLNVFNDYCDKYPMTGMARLFDSLVENGKKILPKDKNAMYIIQYILTESSEASVIQKLLNLRFSDLPISIKPRFKNGRKVEVASWERDGVISDRVKDLIDFSNNGKAGNWSNIEGNKVTLFVKE